MREGSSEDEREALKLARGLTLVLFFPVYVYTQLVLWIARAL